MHQREINEAELANPANWRGGLYRSNRDSRVFVPKQPRWAGWTLNFAHNASVWWLVGLLMLPLAFFISVMVLLSVR